MKLDIMLLFKTTLLLILAESGLCDKNGYFNTFFRPWYIGGSSRNSRPSSRIVPSSRRQTPDYPLPPRPYIPPPPALPPFKLPAPPAAPALPLITLPPMVPTPPPILPKPESDGKNVKGQRPVFKGEKSGEDGTMAHLMRIFGFLPPPDPMFGQRKEINEINEAGSTGTFSPSLPASIETTFPETESTAEPTEPSTIASTPGPSKATKLIPVNPEVFTGSSTQAGTEAPEVTKKQEKVTTQTPLCPFGASPLFLDGDFKSCRPGDLKSCPSDHLCEFSLFLRKHICCKGRVGHVYPYWPDTAEELEVPSETSKPNTEDWKPWTQIVAAWAPWNPKTRAPEKVPVTLPPTTSTTTITSTRSTTRATTPTINNPSTTGSPFWTPWGGWTFWATFRPTVEGKESKGWERTRPTESPIIPKPVPGGPIDITPPKKPVVDLKPGLETNEGVKVTPLTQGRMVKMPNGDFEWETTMTLVQDGDIKILVDTGVPSDTYTLLQGCGHLLFPRRGKGKNKYMQKHFDRNHSTN